jgi:hypothetical protein
MHAALEVRVRPASFPVIFGSFSLNLSWLLRIACGASFAFEVDPMGVVNKAIKDGVGVGGIVAMAASA